MRIHERGCEKIVGRLCQTLSSSRRFTETPYNVSYTVAYQFLTHFVWSVPAVPSATVHKSNVGLNPLAPPDAFIVE